MKFKLTLLIAVALLTFVAPARAQEHELRQPKLPPATTAPAKISSVQLGDRTILIPAPEGFEEGTTQFEGFKQRVVATESPVNDMLVAHLPVSDCELLRKGMLATYAHYTKVSVLRTARELSFSRADLAKAISDYNKNFNSYLDPNGPAMNQLEKHIERGLTNLDSRETNLDLSKPQNLGEFDVRPDVASFLMIVSFKIDSGGVGQSFPVLTSLSFVRVKDRIIFAYSFLRYRTHADIETTKQFTTRWTTSILAANQAR